VRYRVSPTHRTAAAWSDAVEERQCGRKAPSRKKFFGYLLNAIGTRRKYLKYLSRQIKKNDGQVKDKMDNY
jgi:hypothetical protein